MRSTRRDDFGANADAELDAFVRRAQAADLARLPALSAFQRQMDQFPVLSVAAQLELVEKVRAGEKAADLLSRARKPERKAQLAATVKEGQRAANYLVGANFRLVLLICSERLKARFGVDRVADRMPDAVAEANLALAEAVAAFDPARCPNFSTYAARVVRDHIQYVLSRDGTIRVAASWSRLRRIATMRIQVLTDDLGRAPTDSELQADLLEHCVAWAMDRLPPEHQQLPAKKRRELCLTRLRKQGMLGAIRDVNEVLATGQTVASLDAPVGDDGSGSLGDLIVDESGDLGDRLEFAELSATLHEALATLTEREQTIVRMRFGLGTTGEETFTYAEIASLFGVSAERIRQVERAVLDRLASNTEFRRALTGHLASLN